MTVVSVDTDDRELSVTLVADFAAPIERVWELWSDPRKLEAWWGPPGFPATVEIHDLVPGGEVVYVMTGPGGEVHRGTWHVRTVRPPTRLEFEDLAVDADGAVTASMPATRVSVSFAAHGGGTRMRMRSEFESREDLEKWLRTGTREGQAMAVGQMEALLRG